MTEILADAIPILAQVSTLAQATDGSLLGGPTTSPVVAPVEKPFFVALFTHPLFPLVILIGLMYFMIFRTKKKEETKRTSMLKALKKGDRVQTIGGLLGTVVEVRDQDVLLKVDETANVKMRFIRSAISKVVEEEKESK